MVDFRYTCLLETRDIMLDIAQFRSRAEAELFLTAVQGKYPQYLFSVDDVYREHSLQELVDEEKELAELQSGIIKILIIVISFFNIVQSKEAFT